MLDLFSPLRRPVVWMTFVGVAAVVLSGAAIFGAATENGIVAADVAGIVLTAVGLASFAAALVLAMTDPARDDRRAVLQGVDRGRRRRVHRAVTRGDLDALPDTDLLLAFDYADAFAVSMPKGASMALLFVAGTVFVAASPLVGGGGSNPGTLFSIIVASGMAVVASVAFPLVSRYFRNARELLRPGSQADGMPSGA